ncbi:Nuclear transport factor 2 (NTF2) domain [Teratosphaeria destructans]|uniref:Nuclear transport factor 2 (NTF2) domain n=1 Tax=Teratosphaeria destructans TaxID=418781 RepID=A0A9W7SN71_9PEZI|nr:Nuclear transport factor 2 (NTF2) domain [Teratosphaeria destructans]
MAAEVSAMGGVNGYAPHQGYGGLEQQQHNAYNAPASYGQHAPAAPAATAPQNEIPKDEVGWYFVEQYYTTLSRSPEKLYLFYNKRSQFVSGQETDKVAVCVGQRAINDRIKDLDFQDAKVRVTNVDSQASDSNIVIQVIGEISNKSEAPKKFTQTFVLATQTNGYFVLNDIFRYLIEEEDEEPEQEQVAAPAQQEEEVQQVPAAESGYQEPPSTAEPTEPKTLTSSHDADAVEHDAKAVDQELEAKVLKEEKPEEEAPKTNGLTDEQAAAPTSAPESEIAAEPIAAVAEPEQTAAPQPADEPVVEQEKPKDPSPTPAPVTQQAPPQPAAPAKPAAPKTWASLAASAHRVATPAAPAAPVSQTQQSQPRAAPALANKQAAPTPAAAPVPTAPASQREDTASPSQDEWNTVSSSHNRQQSRAANQQQGQQEGPQNRGYIKGVHETVNADELRRHLAQFGEITYFDVARQKNCAFVDFKTAEGYQAAVNGNPHTLGENKLFVEERRVRPGSTPYVPRGQYQGGRGGRGGAQGQGTGRGNFQGQQRSGGYQGARGGRGGTSAGRGRGGGEA